MRQWPQDKIARPINAISASEDPVLRSLDKAQYCYVWTLDLTAAESYSVKNFVVDISNDFYISSISSLTYTTATQVINAGAGLGFLTMRDNASQYTFMEPTLVSLFTSSGAAVFGYKRTMWPEPYPIGAGGSFEASLYLPASSIASCKQQIVIDGWKDYTFGGRKSP